MPTVKPLKFVNINNFTISERLELIKGNTATCYVQLFGDNGQPYFPLAGSTVQITFPRTLSIAATPASQDVTVTATTVDSRNTSVLTFNLTVSQSNNIVSEGIKLIITESAITKTYPVDHFTRQRSNMPGA